MILKHNPLKNLIVMIYNRNYILECGARAGCFHRMMLSQSKKICISRPHWLVNSRSTFWMSILYSNFEYHLFLSCWYSDWNPWAQFK